MKLSWKKQSNNNNNNKKRPLSSLIHTLPFQQHDNNNNDDPNKEEASSSSSSITQLAQSFREQGNKLAEDGKYREALGKWEAAITLTPDKAALHEQKAQLLLELGEPWNALKAATRATELEPSWPEAWITLGRAQLNFGEPDNAIESFDKSLTIKPDSEEAKDDRQTALHLVKKRKQLQASGLSDTKNRFVVGERTENS